ncbi:MAG: 30S ribosomal protein S2 [Candidatus Pacebacteria bacterium]|nr:30S ribosomal protein S2 [Candidatus Paceibacterota bacterium]
MKHKDETIEEEMEETIEQETPSHGFNTDEMMQAGMHLGHRTSKLHPRMKDFISGVKSTVHVVDLDQTAQHLRVALDYIETLMKNNDSLLICGTKVPLSNLVKETANESNLPYVVNRWLGGTFTNFSVISKRVSVYKEMLKGKNEGLWDKYTKKEQVEKQKELFDLQNKFEGLVRMEKLPEAVFICDLIKDKLCLKEAKAKGIKTIAIVDTNADPLLVDYPIPANDDAINSVKFILDKVKEVVLKYKNNTKIET